MRLSFWSLYFRLRPIAAVCLFFYAASSLGIPTIFRLNFVTTEIMAKDYDVQALQPNAGANLSVPLDRYDAGAANVSLSVPRTGVLGFPVQHLFGI